MYMTFVCITSVFIAVIKNKVTVFYLNVFSLLDFI